jgi:hypothetical protein
MNLYKRSGLDVGKMFERFWQKRAVLFGFYFLFFNFLRFVEKVYRVSCEMLSKAAQNFIEAMNMYFIRWCWL